MTQDEEIALLRRQVADLADRLGRIEKLACATEINHTVSVADSRCSCGLYLSQTCSTSPCRHPLRNLGVDRPITTMRQDGSFKDYKPIFSHPHPGGQ